jgi:hypothetical protein
MDAKDVAAALCVTLMVGFLSYQLWSAYFHGKLLALGLGTAGVASRENDPLTFWSYVVFYSLCWGILTPLLGVALWAFYQRGA